MRSARLGALALALLGVGACSSDTTYSYFDVAVTVDTSTFSNDDLKLVGKCLVSVTGSNVLAENFVLGNACLPGQTRADLGTFQWTTTETAGWVQFDVSFYLYSSNADPLAQGTSGHLTLDKGKHVAGSVSVKGISAAPPPADGGADAAPGAGSDGGAG
jgi:hypothetical protein